VPGRYPLDASKVPELQGVTAVREFLKKSGERGTGNAGGVSRRSEVRLAQAETYVFADTNVVRLVLPGGDDIAVSEMGGNLISAVLKGRQIFYHTNNPNPFINPAATGPAAGLAKAGGLSFEFPWTSRLENATFTNYQGKTVSILDSALVRGWPIHDGLAAQRKVRTRFMGFQIRFVGESRQRPVKPVRTSKRCWIRKSILILLKISGPRSLLCAIRSIRLSAASGSLFTIRSRTPRAKRLN